MKTTIRRLRTFIRETLEQSSQIWLENPDYDDDDDAALEFLPNWSVFPKTAYHGTSKANAAMFMSGLTAAANEGLDFAFDPKLSVYYGALKSIGGGDSVIMEIDVTQLDRSQIIINYDIGDSGFTYEGSIPPGAMRVFNTFTPTVAKKTKRSKK